MIDKEKRSRADIEWENRTLCSDESCIGVIGPDGRCKECGLQYEGAFTPTDYESDVIGAEDEASDVDEEFAQEDPDDDGDMDWENRTLCVDESCIGVIGPDGWCKECGKPYIKAGS
jgi:hypothetical protein